MGTGEVKRTHAIPCEEAVNSAGDTASRDIGAHTLRPAVAMHWFLKLLIYPLLEAIRPEVIVEVGVEVGTVTGPLLRWAQINGAVVHAIDPDPTLNVDRLQAEFAQQLCFHRRKSLEVLSDIAAVELALIDGDHNWYTVINELRALERRASEDGREPPVMLLHDVGWPYGRRDLYYDPQSIPEAERQPHARKGIKPGRMELGAGLNAHLENALLEGTPGNGVLTAVEGFRGGVKTPVAQLVDSGPERHVDSRERAGAGGL